MDLPISESKQSAPQLLGYLRFFQLLADLEAQSLITTAQKQTLKASFTLRDPQLISLLSGCKQYSIDFLLVPNSQQMAQQLVQLAKSQEQSAPTTPLITRYQRSRSVAFDNTRSSDLLAQISQLTSALLEQGGVLDPALDGPLAQFEQLISTLRHGMESTPKRDLLGAMRASYRQLKAKVQAYMHSLLLLMEEDISYRKLFQFVKHLVKNLVDCSEFSFAVIKPESLEVYQSATDSFDTTAIDPFLQEELAQVAFGKVTQLTMMFIYPGLCRLVNNPNFHRSFLLKTRCSNQTVLFFFHQKHQADDSPIYNFLKLANEYKFCEEVETLAQFLYETIRQAKVQFFRQTTHPLTIQVHSKSAT